MGEPSEVTDEILLAAAGRGDHSALTALYERHAGWLTLRLSRRCSNSDVVDTAVQDTFVAVWRGAARYRPTGEVGAWIWTIGLRRLVDGVRKRPPPVPVDPVANPLLAIAALNPAAEAFVDTEVGIAFRRLSPELQAVLEATALDGLTTKEASVLLGIPQGTVKTRLARARMLLREQLA